MNLKKQPKRRKIIRKINETMIIELLSPDVNWLKFISQNINVIINGEILFDGISSRKDKEDGPWETQ